MFIKLILSLLFKSNPAPRHERPRQTSYKVKALTESALKIIIQDLPKVDVLNVIDGDTIIISKYSRTTTTIRLDAIDCPEDGQEWGDISKYGLIKLIGGQSVHLEEHGIDNYGRTLGTIHVWNQEKSSWINVNEQMVMLGHAWVMRKFYDHLPKERQEKLNRLEQWARSKKIGLWSKPNPIPPWQWRRTE